MSWFSQSSILQKVFVLAIVCRAMAASLAILADVGVRDGHAGVSVTSRDAAKLNICCVDGGFAWIPALIWTGGFFGPMGVEVEFEDT